MNLASCSRLPHVPLTGTWYRAIQPPHWPTLNQVAHTRRIPSRFNPGADQFAILHLAETPVVAQYEVQALLGTLTGAGGPIPNPRYTWIMLNIIVQLRAVVDLTHATSLHLLETNTQELTGAWCGYPQRGPLVLGAPPVGTVPTQDLGAALFAVPGLEGFCVFSARIPYFRTLVVFPEKLQSGSQVIYENPQTRQTVTFPP